VRSPQTYVMIQWPLVHFGEGDAGRPPLVTLRLEKAPCHKPLKNLGNVRRVNVLHLPKSLVREPSFEIRRNEGLKLESLET